MGTVQSLRKIRLSLNLAKLCKFQLGKLRRKKASDNKTVPETPLHHPVNVRIKTVDPDLFAEKLNIWS